MMSLARQCLAVVASSAVMTLFMTGGFPLGARGEQRCEVADNQGEAGEASQCFHFDGRWQHREIDRQDGSPRCNAPRAARLF